MQEEQAAIVASLPQASIIGSEVQGEGEVISHDAKPRERDETQKPRKGYQRQHGSRGHARQLDSPETP